MQAPQHRQLAIIASIVGQQRGSRAVIVRPLTFAPPRRRDVTVCIAARCKDGEDDRIVLCTDRKSSTILGSAETAFKQHRLADKWWCLASGDEPDILALVHLYAAHFGNNKGKIPRQGIYDFLKAPLRQRKAALCEDFIQSKFAISYEDFIKEGKGRFPPDQFYGTMQAILELDLKASLILAGFIEREPVIFTTDTDGMLRPTSDFAVGGEGGYIAQSSLLRRQCNRLMSMHRVLYLVYEAKTLAEAVGSVGEQSIMTVLTSRTAKGFEFVTGTAKEQMAQMFKKYGPQPVTEVKFQGKIFLEGQDEKKDDKE